MGGPLPTLERETTLSLISCTDGMIGELELLNLRDVASVPAEWRGRLASLFASLPFEYPLALHRYPWSPTEVLDVLFDLQVCLFDMKNRRAIVSPGSVWEGLDTDPLTGSPTVAHSELRGEIYETASGRRGVVAGPSRLFGESEVIVAIPLADGERPLSTRNIFRRDGRRYELLSVAATLVIQQLRQRKLARGESLDMPRPGQSRGHVRPSAERVARHLDPVPRRRRLPIPTPPAQAPEQPPRPPSPLAAGQQTTLMDLVESGRAQGGDGAAPHGYVAEVGERGRVVVWYVAGDAPQRFIASGRDLVAISRNILEHALDIDADAMRADSRLQEQFALDCMFVAERFLRPRSKTGWAVSQADIRAWMAYHRPPSLAYVRLPNDSLLAEEKQRWLQWSSRQTPRDLIVPSPAIAQ